MISIIFFNCEEKATTPQKAEPVEMTEDVYNEMVSILDDGVEFFKEQQESDTLKAILNTIAWLDKQENIKNSGLSNDSTTIWIEYKNGIKAVFETKTHFLENDGNNLISNLSVVKKKNYTIPNQKVIILETLSGTGEPDGKIFAENLAAFLEKYDFTNPKPVIKSNDDVNLDLISTLDDDGYGIISILSHGGLWRNKPYIWTGLEFDLFNAQTYLELFLADMLYIAVALEIPTRIGIRPGFIANFGQEGYNGAFINLNSCNGAYDDLFPNAFMEHGAGACIGWDKQVTKLLAQTTALSLFHEMIDNGKNIGAAKQQLDSENKTYDPRYTSYMKKYGSDKLTLVGLTFPEPQTTTMKTPMGYIAKYSLSLQNTYKNDLITELSRTQTSQVWDVNFYQNGAPISGKIKIPGQDRINFEAHISVPNDASEGEQEQNRILAESEQSYDYIDLITIVDKAPELKYKWAQVSVFLACAMRDQDNNIYTDKPSALEFPPYYNKYAEGSCKGNTFSGTWNINDDGDISRGRISITIDPQNYDLLTFTAEDTFITATETIYKYVSGFDLVNKSLNSDNLRYYRSFHTNRETCADHISIYSYLVEFKSGGWAQITRFFEDDRSKISIELNSHL